MKAYLQSLWCDTNNGATNYSGLYYMSGTPPTDKASLDAAVNLKSPADVHAKAVGFGFVQGQSTYTNTGIGKISALYNALSDKMSWLKKASVPVLINSVAYYYQVADRAYREDGLSDMWRLPPGVLSFPCFAANIWQGASFKALVSPNMRHKESAAVLSTVAFIFEYDTPTTVSGIAKGTPDAPAGGGNDYFYYTKVEYWNGSAWVQVLANSVHTAGTVHTWTPVTAQKFRVTPQVYSNSSATVATFASSFMLLHTAAMPAVSVPDITWGIIVPLPYSNQSASYGVYDVTGSTLPPTDLELRTYAYGRSINYMASEANYMPAIIDTAGLDASVNKMALSKASSLLSTDRPTLLAYKYNLGDLA